MANDRKSRLAQFVEWSAKHITGDEKGQAQIFLDRLFQAFGQKGSLEVGLRRAQSSRAPPRCASAARPRTAARPRFADSIWKSADIAADGASAAPGIL